MRKKRLNFRKCFQEQNEPKVGIHTVKSSELVFHGLVNLSTTGLAFKLQLNREGSDQNFQLGDMIFLNLEELGIEIQGVSARVVRVEECTDGGIEYGLRFINRSETFKKSLESSIGWSQVQKILRAKRSARAVYAGLTEGREIPAWMEGLMGLSASRKGRVYIENPLRAKSHLVDWVESSLDGDQLGVSLTQAL